MNISNCICVTMDISNYTCVMSYSFGLGNNFSYLLLFISFLVNIYGRQNTRQRKKSLIKVRKKFIFSIKTHPFAYFHPNSLNTGFFLFCFVSSFFLSPFSINIIIIIIYSIANQPNLFRCR